MSELNLNDLEHVSGGASAEGARRTYIVQPGDTLSMGGEFGDVVIESVSWLSDECVQVQMAGDLQWQRFCFGPYSDSLWWAYGDSDQPYSYRGERKLLTIPPGAGICLRYPDGELKPVADLHGLIARLGQSSANLDVLVSGHQVKGIQREWYEWYDY